MSEAASTAPQAARRRIQLSRRRSIDRLSASLGVLFVICGAYYLWTAGSTVPLSLHSGTSDRYNLMATALLHLRLSVGAAPEALMRLANPYDPRQFNTLPGAINSSINDDAMNHGQLYFVWGPAPALVLLVPLHLLGFEPSASVTESVFAIAGLGFVLASLRVLLRKTGVASVWMCILAGLALALASAVPFILRTPSVSEDTLAGGYCFTMAGIWLALSALAEQKDSRARLVLMSLAFGLAANSRPDLALTALILIPVYRVLRRRHTRRTLLLSLALPVGICFALLLAYNQARFNSPLEVGSRFQLTGYYAPTAPYGHLDYVPHGAVYYGLTPPRLAILFPFFLLVAPGGSVTGLAPPEPTAGLLVMAPIVIFIAALPWLWRRRPALLGPLAPPMLILAGVGLLLPLLASYQLFAPTERYEVDFATLLLLAGVAAWLSLSKGSGRRHRLVRILGGLLLASSCITGLGISFIGFGSELASTNPRLWRTFQDLGTPFSTAIAVAVGHPVLAAVNANQEGTVPPGYGDLGNGVSEVELGSTETAEVVIVSPGSRKAVFVAAVRTVPGSYSVSLDGGGRVIGTYALPPGGGTIQVPLSLSLGLNRFALVPVSNSKGESSSRAPVMLVGLMSVS